MEIKEDEGTEDEMQIRYIFSNYKTPIPFCMNG